ncbi:hypothetical protein DFH07DRAFT_955419 [Mycena maculata]|uniref:Uncharacterized protein n=1 Tax=Mycena maculata TaxID=230809 RepID=A0AAD7JNV0_9AGAR|nr:hypothetical protein DFH07DRAFT_955419 [Mycena maculata]
MGKLGKRKRPSVRSPKSQRGNLKFWVEGAREEILMPYMEEYNNAMREGWRQERLVLQRICNEFHARVDWKLEDDEEPELKAFDVTQAAQKETLPEDEEKAKHQRIKVLNARIRRWYKYCIRKLRKHRATDVLDPKKDPYAVLVAKLSRMTAPPKARQAYQQFQVESHTDKIAPVVQERWEIMLKEAGEEHSKKQPKAGFHAQVARELLAKLPVEEQKALGERATKVAKEAREAYDKFMKEPASKLPADRQKCIDKVPEFLAGLQEYTGMHSVLVMGGPVPKYGGEIRTVHVSFGRNNTTAAQHFSQWDKEHFNRDVLEFMREYCATAFTEKECHEAALPNLADLSKAKYTIQRTEREASDGTAPVNTLGGTLGDDSDSSDSSDSDSDSESDSSDSDSSDSEGDEEEEAPARKKRKEDGGKQKMASAMPADSAARKKRKEGRGKQKKTASAMHADSVPRDAAGLTYMEAREANVRRNQALAIQFRAQAVADGLFPPLKPPRVPRARQAPAARRKSTRLGGGEGGGESLPGDMEVEPVISREICKTSNFTNA